ncbi:MAG: MarR family winged helix-turn-helix transcriptional regulator [Pseudodesulfovibrio sp.]|jgi:DNA-binding MarR family transcriptional regulator|uniref:MarR family transcriptional regulator n=1 Tax=Pseudodesulfovibrio indicus TaxID=1716143 RepID=A0A126QMC0_9BACT|nr:MarR family transcriptional regulator [Pseudodesulfovibrio indicus]AMK11102.1 MarR family transcriptional regulator [Pseudodesulfovibrio indicus]TDT92117.1 DNA-binding MarR family transcriptional regulator [Pseudodesulfovibrio indicus]
MKFDRMNPRESIGFLAWKVARVFANDLAARFAEAGVRITVEQWRALLPAYKMDGLTQGKLCEVLSQEKTGVSRLVAALERHGLIRRESSGEDRRVKYIYITESGRELVDFTFDIVLEGRRELVKHVDPDEFEVCKRVLWQIIEPHLGACCGLKEEPS